MLAMPLSLNRFFLLFCCVIFSACAMQPLRSEVALQLGGDQTLEGAGLTLTVPKLVNGEWLGNDHLKGWYEPNDSHSPIFYRIFRCSLWGCKDHLHGTFTVNIKRLKTTDLQRDPTDSVQARIRAPSVPAEFFGAWRPNVDTSVLVDYVRPDAVWVRRTLLTATGGTAGYSYTRIIVGDYSLSVRFRVHPPALPEGVTVEDIRKSTEAFIDRIKISGTPNRM
jgi:hypothetical protein